MQETLRHEFAIEDDLFWHLFFDEKFNLQNHLEHLRFPSFEIVRLDRHPDGSIERVIKAKPSMKVPAVVQAMIGDSASYEERGRFDPNTRRWNAVCTPAVLGDRVRTTMAIWTETVRPGWLQQVIELEVNADMPGLGRMIESGIMRQTVALFEASRDYLRLRLEAMQSGGAAARAAHVFEGPEASS